MNDNDKQMLFLKATQKFGTHNQNIKAIEEMAELIKALVKYELGDKSFNSLENIKEEVVDVKLMMEQLISTFDFKLYAGEIENQKLNRLTVKLRSP